LGAPDAQWVAIRPAWLPLLLSRFSAQSLEAMVLRYLRDRRIDLGVDC
jgi:hypothetical protein